MDIFLFEPREPNADAPDEPIGDLELNQLQIFFIRAIIGGVFAVIITRIFTGRIHIPYIAGLAIIMVGLAYFSEYLRKRKSR